MRAADLQHLQQSPQAFRDALRINADQNVVRLGSVSDDWQRDDFEALDAGWQIAAGQTPSSTAVHQRAWLERPRGHSKTADLACMCTWVLFASMNRLAGYAAAADRDQARLLRDAIERLVRMNPWLSKVLKVDANKIRNIHTGSTLEVMSSDGPTSYGLTPDFVICDEVTHWTSGDLWDSLISSAGKRDSCMFVVITNAGVVDSWQWNLREEVRNDPAWHVSILDGPQASWLTPARLEEQRRLLPSIVYQRLWMNEWTSGSGDALQPDDIDKAITLAGPLHEPEPGWMYVAGVDIGLSKDASAVVVVGRHIGHIESKVRRRHLTLHDQRMVLAGLLDEPQDEYEEHVIHGTGRLKVAAVKLWQPQHGARVSLDGVERAIRRLDDTFRLTAVGCDPWQSVHMQQNLSHDMRVVDVPFSSSNLRAMCTATLEAFSERLIDLYDHTQLVRDLRALQIEEKSYGARLASPRTTTGHGDAATALAIALHVCNQFSHSAIGADTPTSIIAV